MLERKYDNFYHYVDYIFDLSVEKKNEFNYNQ